jgi:hypothetical protein
MTERKEIKGKERRKRRKKESKKTARKAEVI